MIGIVITEVMELVHLLENKRIIIAIIILIITISLISISIFFKRGATTLSINQGKNITYSLVGKEFINIYIGETYIDEGIIFEKDGKNSINEIETEENININEPGEYYVKYLYNNEAILIRQINVLDNIPPEIKLNGKKEITLIQGSRYEEKGYVATDNLDGNITSKVKIIGTVNTSKVGTYKIEYSITDSSDNKTSVKRNVKVIKKPTTVIKKVSTTEKGEEENYIIPEGEVTSLTWTNNGISIEGCVNTKIKNLKLNDIEYAVNITNKCYKGNLNLTNLDIGEYILYYSDGDKSNKVINKLSLSQKIVRSKIGEKLYTFTYENDEIKLAIEKFSYQYDILIDVGHGGHDSGAINFLMMESFLNLEISKYEKKRFEDHGLKVLMTRDNDTYGMVMGSTNWSYVHQRAYAVGHYSVVSKISYSNHHNSFPKETRMGYEIIVPASLSNSMLKDEKEIISIWKTFYPLTENHVRLYARNYDTDSIKTKENNDIYSFRNYYAMNRIPYELYNSKVVIYEGCYMSNLEDFTWYYLNKNWIQVSEAKIKVYVESLGKTYIPPIDDIY